MPGLMAAVFTAIIVTGFALASGGMVFSSGALNARAGAPLCGMSSHADIAHKCNLCHAEPSVHAGQFGTECAKCHNTSNWNATFNHPGGCAGNCANHEHATCADCHPVNYSTATYTKCHDSNTPGGGDLDLCKKLKQGSDA